MDAGPGLASGASAGAFIDADVHPRVRGPMFEALKPYLTSSWQKRFELRRGLPDLRWAPPFDPKLGGANRPETTSPDGAPPGSDPVWVAKQLLDGHNVAASVLIDLAVGLASCLPPDDSIAINAALNDYYVNEWLPVDHRYKLAIGVSPQDPVEAAREIRRSAAHENVVAAFLPPINILMGNRYYYPIYEAAQECGLPILYHFSVVEGDRQGSPTMPVGVPQTVAERSVMRSSLAEANMVNLIYEGTFERFPKLKVIFVEMGFAWAAWTMWTMDERWRGMRREIPWVKKRPSEYVADHIRFTTQPLIDHGDQQRYLLPVLEMIQADRTLLFSTDYPHWDLDYPESALSSVPAPLKRRLLLENALETFPRIRLDAGAVARPSSGRAARPAAAVGVSTRPGEPDFEAPFD